MNVQSLAKFELFRKVVEQLVPFSDDEWTIFQSCLNLFIAQRKEFFVQAEDACNSIGFIITGSVRYYHLKGGVQT